MTAIESLIFTRNFLKKDEKKELVLIQNRALKRG